MPKPKIQYRVKETWKVTAWTTVYASSRDEAYDKINNAEGETELEYKFFDEEWEATDFTSLEEA